MSSIEISQADITGLADALDGLRLNGGQKALLSAIVTVAANAMANKAEPGAVVEGTDPTMSFHDQFATAFTPGTVEGAGTPANGLSVMMGTIFKIGRNG
ncbi:hypothetical protein Rhe02_41380 [Rhizocola hellebori]|uniref:Uncharacterized protein n=1 Tax=Rhizocola hellebori TaxID=1392758 RepID=A0A8J3VHI1_9ACTN|nr:hypothetical protein [Rhizocola hellebori]GIH06071.1 hypothetical protein Rhe02_41380 [Rhizocola hellebori]